MPRSVVMTIPKSDAGKSGIALRKRNIAHNYPTHLHSIFEVEYIISGEAIVHFDGRSVKMHPKTLKICTPLDVERIEVLSDEITLVNINFTEDYLNPEILSNLTTGFVIYDVEDNLISLLIEEFENDRQYNLLYKKNLLNLILLDAIRKKIANSPDGEGKKPDSNSVAQQVALFIHLHYMEPLTLKEISSHFSYTHNHLSKIFQYTFNMSITQYLCKTRLSQAEKLLRCSDMTVTQIYNESGFPSLSTFFRIFKQHYGISPKEFQKKTREKDKIKV